MIIVVFIDPNTFFTYRLIFFALKARQIITSIVPGYKKYIQKKFQPRLNYHIYFLMSIQLTGTHLFRNRKQAVLTPRKAKSRILLSGQIHKRKVRLIYKHILILNSKFGAHNNFGKIDKVYEIKLKM